jgi:AAA domain
MSTLTDPFTPVLAPPPTDMTGVPTFERHGDEFCMAWGFPPVSMTISRVRESSRGITAELSVTHGGQEIHWGEFNLASTAARETVVKKLQAILESEPWRLMLERTVRSTRDAVRQGEPFVTLTGRPTSPTLAVLPPLLYEGAPTEFYGDGDTGKSLMAITIGVALQSGASLPGGLKPARAVHVAYLDWETHLDDIEARMGPVAAGLGIDPPPILYKRMTRPLVDEASTLAAEFSRRRIGCVVVDSKMYALGRGEFHESVPAFYSALRLFAPAASLIINHITNEDARTGRAARPFGGAFAFNGPRLVWQATRARDITDETAIAFTCTKANNLPRKPAPFGLRFKPGEGTITVFPMAIREVATQSTTAAPISWRLRVTLASGSSTAAELALTLNADPETVKKALQRGRRDERRPHGPFVLLDGNRWGLAQ